LAYLEYDISKCWRRLKTAYFGPVILHIDFTCDVIGQCLYRQIYIQYAVFTTSTLHYTVYINKNTIQSIVKKNVNV